MFAEQLWLKIGSGETFAGIQLNPAVQAGGGFSIGPFGFGGSYQRTTIDVKFDDSNNTITATDLSETPQIMGVMSNVLPNPH
jgi:hypothetical protein